MKYLQKIIETGIYFFLFILPIQTRFILNSTSKVYLEYNIISIYASDIVLVFIILFFLILSFWKRQHNIEFKIPYSLVISVLDLFIFISIFYADNKDLAIYRYLIFLSGIWLFYILNNKYISLNTLKLIYSFVLGIIFQASIGIYQFFSQNILANKYFGIAMHNPKELGVSVVQVSDGQRWLRAYGGLGHPNMFGGIMVIGLLFVVGILLSKKNRKNDIYFNNYVLLFFYILMLFALFFSFSRSSWLAFSVNISFVLMWYAVDNWEKNKKVIIQIFTLSCLAGLIFFINYSNLILTRVKGDTRLENKSRSERMAYLQYAKDIINDNGVTGTGIGNYSTSFQKIKKGQEIWYYQPVHNVFILVLAEIGIFGFLSYLNVLFAIFYSNFRRRRIINLSIFFSFVILMMFDHWIWSMHFGVLFFWVSMAMIVKCEF